jgi:F-type H+-transporting ATPase subunit delta
MSRITQRYAVALADVALARNQTGPARDGLAAFSQVWAESAGLRNFITSPAVPSPAKHELIDKLAPPLEIIPAVRNCLHLLVDHKRMALLPAIRTEFDEELRRRLGIAQADVASAMALNEQEKSALLGALAHVTGKKIEAQYRLDANLIGGAVVRIGSTVYDGSVREQLARLQSQLEADS